MLLNAVLIRQLDALTKIMLETTSADQRELLLAQAEMIMRLAEESISEEADRRDVRREYDEVLAAAAIAGARGAAA